MHWKNIKMIPAILEHVSHLITQGPQILQLHNWIISAFRLLWGLNLDGSVKGTALYLNILWLFLYKFCFISFIFKITIHTCTFIHYIHILCVYVCACVYSHKTNPVDYIIQDNMRNYKNHILKLYYVLKKSSKTPLSFAVHE